MAEERAIYKLQKISRLLEVVLFPESVSDNEVTNSAFRNYHSKGTGIKRSRFDYGFISCAQRGEYDLTNVLPILPDKGSLKLSTILRGDRDLSLSIPESTLIEWQWLALTD